jgi:prepilin-type N-terminal cleavage/methylation domain-containing protein
MKIKAFTIAELVVALAISAVVTAIGYYSIGAVGNTLRLRNEQQNQIEKIQEIRVLLEHDFSRYQQRRFFSHEYTISSQSDRMGCRLEGPEIQPEIDGILSEGICLGAIQVPPDGQPIILMHDRQTIGGYPKIGSVLSLDLGPLAQLKPGDKVYFEPITVDDAHNILHLADSYFNKIEPVLC